MISSGIMIVVAWDSSASRAIGIVYYSPLGYFKRKKYKYVNSTCRI